APWHRNRLHQQEYHEQVGEAHLAEQRYQAAQRLWPGSAQPALELVADEIRLLDRFQRAAASARSADSVTWRSSCQAVGSCEGTTVASGSCSENALSSRSERR